MNLTINVTQEDIERGKRRDCFSCPINRATQRTLGLKYIQTGRSQLHIHKEFKLLPHNNYQLINLPPIAHKFIEYFDTGNRPQAFSFTISIDPKHIKYCED